MKPKINRLFQQTHRERERERVDRVAATRICERDRVHAANAAEWQRQQLLLTGSNADLNSWAQFGSVRQNVALREKRPTMRDGGVVRRGGAGRLLGRLVARWVIAASVWVQIETELRAEPRLNWPGEGPLLGLVSSRVAVPLQGSLAGTTRALSGCQGAGGGRMRRRRGRSGWQRKGRGRERGKWCEYTLHLHVRGIIGQHPGWVCAASWVCVVCVWCVGECVQQHLRHSHWMAATIPFSLPAFFHMPAPCVEAFAYWWRCCYLSPPLTPSLSFRHSGFPLVPRPLLVIVKLCPGSDSGKRCHEM